MSRSWLFAFASLSVSLIAAAASAQTRSWDAVANGLWNTPASWSPADVPDTAAESATFDLFGTYTVTLDGSTGPVAINHLNVVRGGVTLRPNGLADATISATGNVSLAGDVTLAEIVGTHLHLQAQGALSVASGTQVHVEGGSLAASSTTIAGGTATDSTVVVLDDGATGDFGSLVIAPSGSLISRAGLDLYDGSSATVHGLSIAAAAASGVGELNVKGSTLTQPAASTTTVGAVNSVTDARGALTVSTGGVMQLGSVVVNPTGLLINDRGSLSVAGPSFTVHGGKYVESGAATRDFTAATNLRISAGGEISLVGAPLTIPAHQTVTVLDGVLRSSGGISVEGGALAIGAGASVIGDVSWESEARLVVDFDSGEEVAALYVNGVASLGGTLDFESLGSMAIDLEEGVSLPLLTASSLIGEFDALMGPALASGLDWSFEQTPTSLVATVIAAPLDGDYNDDGLVNAADYTVWRDSVAAGAPVGSHAEWAANYGATAAGAVVSVPEPGLSAVAVALLGGAVRRRLR